MCTPEPPWSSPKPASPRSGQSPSCFSRTPPHRPRGFYPPGGLEAVWPRLWPAPPPSPSPTHAAEARSPPCWGALHSPLTHAAPRGLPLPLGRKHVLGPTCFPGARFPRTAAAHRPSPHSPCPAYAGWSPSFPRIFSAPPRPRPSGRKDTSLSADLTPQSGPAFQLCLYVYLYNLLVKICPIKQGKLFEKGAMCTFLIYCVPLISTVLGGCSLGK